MAILSNIAVVLVLVCIAHQVLVTDCQRGQGKKGKNDGRRSDRGNKEGPPKTPPDTPADNSGQKTQGGKGVFKGKISHKDKTQCTWVATGEDTFTLGVNCKKGRDTFDCEYTARPATCPRYASGVRAYWKQIGRALKKQKALCKDPAALVKAGMCRNAPKDAHFKLNSALLTHLQTTQPPPSSDGKQCGDGENTVQEYCSGPWSSVCTFFYSMFQTEDC
ncbi:fibroblast growth factor-binding protein 1-like [Megalops cyprinoides]|uniref:fibroblast growth factor-binding protein 1-like n=1 Tax=Megalops cyprinoides TaxID=118141 RepID=UPI00186402E8|nr:fibroblast growth factor-binding protein 1-like [Megalops cyprinoides]